MDLNTNKYTWEQLENMMANLILSQQETREQMMETDRKLNKWAKLYGGVSSNSKDFAKEYFLRGLENRNEIFGISYEYVDSMRRHKGKLQGEYDIVLYNRDKMIVIEVKYKLHPNDVDDFHHRKLPMFRKLYPEFKEKQIIGGLAAMSVPLESLEKAMHYGFLVLTQSGKDLSVLNQRDFEPKFY